MKSGLGPASTHQGTVGGNGLALMFGNANGSISGGDFGNFRVRFGTNVP